MTREEIEQLYVEEPNCFETDREEQWYKVGLREGLAAADSHPAWVSVEDELPKERGKLYLVCDKYGRVGESAYDVEDDIWYRQSGMVLNPTHWMPLPQLPVKKGGEQ